MPKIILKGHIIVPKEDLETVKTALLIHIKLTQCEPGNLVFNVMQDESNNNKFHVYEEFINQTAFEFHQKRVKQSKWGLVTKGVERHYEIFERN
jgi:quinol monooxygenase YgiN